MPGETGETTDPPIEEQPKSAIPPTPEAESKGIAEQLRETVAREGGRGALEDLAGESGEQTTEQQKVEELFNRVSEINEQLGNEVANEVQMSNDSTTLIFRMSTIGRYRDRFGVNSQDGPVRLTALGKQRYLNSIVHGMTGEAATMHPEDFSRVTTPDQIKGWQETFENSRDTVLKNQEAMQRVREQRNQALDSALDVVSKPIDIDAPPSPTAPSGPGK